MCMTGEPHMASGILELVADGWRMRYGRTGEDDLVSLEIRFGIQVYWKAFIALERGTFLQRCYIWLTR